MVRSLFIYLLPLGILLSSCEKEESPVTLPPKPDHVHLMKIELGDDYAKQVFVNLETGQTVETDNNAWDLAFDASAPGRSIFINGGKNVLIANAGATQFQSNINPLDLQWKWDAASGIEDSLALRHCFNHSGNSHDSVYVINRGLSTSDPENYFQFQVKSATPHGYTLRFADMHGQQVKDITIPKDPTKSKVYFSFGSGGNYHNFEPAKTDWHFCFLRYRWIYYEFNPPLLYQVTGIYINPGKVSVAIDSTLQFYDIRKEHSLGKHYSSRRDIIGFDWKVPDFKPTGVEYITRKHVNYFIRESSGSQQVYKIRFIDFYNEQGVKGSPRFEMQVLN